MTIHLFDSYMSNSVAKEGDYPKGEVRTFFKENVEITLSLEIIQIQNFLKH